MSHARADFHQYDYGAVAVTYEPAARQVQVSLRPLAAAYLAHLLQDPIRIARMADELPPEHSYRDLDHLRRGLDSVLRAAASEAPTQELPITTKRHKRLPPVCQIPDCGCTGLAHP